jgi:spore coat protein U-like protein
MKLSTRLLAASALVIASGLAAAEGKSSTALFISSQVEANCYIKVQPSSKATTLDIVNGERETVIAKVFETCNNATGYNVYLSSDNRGNLMPKFDGATREDIVGYELIYDGARGTITEQMEAYRERAEFERGAALMISIPGNRQALAGYYYDNITLTIAAR